MWLNKSIAIINSILKILDITSLRFIYIFNKFGFRIGTFNPNMSFLIVDAHFCKFVSKSPYGGKPNEKQDPKACQQDQRAREVQRKKCKEKQSAAEYKFVAEYRFVAEYSSPVEIGRAHV